MTAALLLPPQRPNIVHGMIVQRHDGVTKLKALPIDALGKIKRDNGAVGFNLNASGFGFFVERDATHSGDMDSSGHNPALFTNGLIHQTRPASPRVTTADDCRKSNGISEALACEGATV